MRAEALGRLFDVIRTAAAEGNKQPQGVFADFGKPYAPCGAIIEVGLGLQGLRPGVPVAWQKVRVRCPKAPVPGHSVVLEGVAGV